MFEAGTAAEYRGFILWDANSVVHVHLLHQQRGGKCHPFMSVWWEYLASILHGDCHLQTTLISSGRTQAAVQNKEQTHSAQHCTKTKPNLNDQGRSSRTGSYTCQLVEGQLLPKHT